MKKDIKELVQICREQGYEVFINGGGHWEVRKDGRRIGCFPATPSEYRGYLNTISRLRRAGVEIPHKGRR